MSSLLKGFQSLHIKCGGQKSVPFIENIGLGLKEESGMGQMAPSNVGDLSSEETLRKVTRCSPGRTKFREIVFLGVVTTYSISVVCRVAFFTSLFVEISHL